MAINPIFCDNTISTELLHTFAITSLTLRLVLNASRQQVNLPRRNAWTIIFELREQIYLIYWPSVFNDFYNICGNCARKRQRRLIQLALWHRKLAIKLDPSSPKFICMTVQWASCQIRKIAGAHAPGMPGTFSPSPQVSDPDMHHGTCVTHVPWCMPGSLTSGFLWNRRRGKTFPAFPAHAQPAILLSGKRPITQKINIVSFTVNRTGRILEMAH